MFLKKQILARLDACKVNNEVIEHSRLAKLGNRMIQIAVIIQVIEPVLLLIMAIILMNSPALAQGSIFGGNNQDIGNGVREAIRWGRNMLFLLGVGGVGWGTINYMTEKPFMKPMLGGGLSMCVGGVIELIRSFSQGNAVNLDTNLGN